jgi:excisionase family DNA binding protein
MKNSTILHEISPDQIKDLFVGLQNQITNLKEDYEPKAPTEWLTRAEVAEMLKVDLSTIHNYCVKQKLIAYGIGSRVYFKRSEVEAAIIPLRKVKEIG